MDSSRGIQFLYNYALGLEQKHVLELIASVDLGISIKLVHNVSMSPVAKLSSFKRLVMVKIKYIRSHPVTEMVSFIVSESIT